MSTPTDLVPVRIVSGKIAGMAVKGDLVRLITDDDEVVDFKVGDRRVYLCGIRRDGTNVNMLDLAHLRCWCDHAIRNKSTFEARVYNHPRVTMTVTFKTK